MNLGRFTLGQFVPLAVACRTGEAAYAPAAAPRAAIYNSSGVKIASPRLPSVDKGAITGFFVLPLRLDSNYSVGRYSVAINYVANNVVHLDVHHFEIVAGGNSGGAIISQHFYDRPHAKFLVQKLDSFQRRLVKNPRSS